MTETALTYNALLVDCEMEISIVPLALPEKVFAFNVVPTERDVLLPFLNAVPPTDILTVASLELAPEQVTLTDEIVPLIPEVLIVTEEHGLDAVPNCTWLLLPLVGDPFPAHAMDQVTALYVLLAGLVDSVTCTLLLPFAFWSIVIVYVVPHALGIDNVSNGISNHNTRLKNGCFSH